MVLVLDTHALVDKIHVVADQSVTTVLGNDSKSNEKHQPISVALGTEEIHVSAGLLDFELEADCLLDFLVFELNRRVMDIAVSVVFGKRCQRFFWAIMGNVPTWRFWDP